MDTDKCSRFCTHFAVLILQCVSTAGFSKIHSCRIFHHVDNFPFPHITIVIIAFHPSPIPMYARDRTQKDWYNKTPGEGERCFTLLLSFAVWMTVQQIAMSYRKPWFHYLTDVGERGHHSLHTYRSISPANSSVSSLPEKRHIVFLKVHKAASTTVQNILLRFGLARNLSVLLMKKHTCINETGTFINPKKIMPHPPGMKFDILTNHIVFDRRQIAPYFPKSTVYVSIIREPFQLFRSAFIYFSQVWRRRDLRRCIKDNPLDPIGQFLQQPLTYKTKDLRKSYVNNRMSVDFGFPPQQFELAKRDRRKIEAFVAEVHRTFSLILIADMFDESMVLLKRYMNWEMKDILYLRLNTYQAETKNSRNDWIHRTSFSQKDRDLFASWAIMDIILYNTSLKIFKEKIAKEREFQEEVDTFRDIRRTVATFCLSHLTSETQAFVSPLVVPANIWTNEFEVTIRDCQLMALEETSLVEFVRYEQMVRWNIPLPTFFTRLLEFFTD